MRKRRWSIVAALVVTLSCGMMGLGQTAYAADAGGGKKAILVVSFGTTFADTRKATIDAVTDKIKAAFPDYEVRQAFTSRIIIKRLADRDGLKYDTEKQALQRLATEGFTDVLIQPLHVEAGEEYEQLMGIVAGFKTTFATIKVGRPILYYTGQEGVKPDDYRIALKALQSQLPKLGPSDAVCLMGHGGVAPANAAYGALQLKIQDVGVKNLYVFTVEGYPSLEDMVARMKKDKIKNVTLMPFMLVAGDHANNDMAGDEPDSFKSQLTKAGFKVKAYIHGLGENRAIQDIYVQHLKDAIDDTYTKRGEDRPPIPVID